jgi:hypothetical protein
MPRTVADQFADTHGIIQHEMGRAQNDLRERHPMRDVKSDWKRWSFAERVSAVALIVAFVFIYASAIAGALTG